MPFPFVVTLTPNFSRLGGLGRGQFVLLHLLDVNPKHSQWESWIPSFNELREYFCVGCA